MATFLANEINSTERHKGPGKRGHIVADDVSRARKRAGNKMNVVFPC